MNNASYYVIKTLMPDEDSWSDDSIIYHYVYGTSRYFEWSPFPGDARRFKNIQEIRGFITRALRPDGNMWAKNQAIKEWVFEGIFTIPSSAVITSVHTMGLLRSVK